MKAALLTALLVLPLVGCMRGNWTKPGADADATTIALQQCQATADIAVGPEEGIDQDILATRQTDWQRSPLGGLAASRLGEETHDRAAKIVAGCMRAKGFALTK